MDDTTFAERLQILRDNYYMMIGPLLILLGGGLGSSRILFWVAATFLVLLTANKLAPMVLHRND